MAGCRSNSHRNMSSAAERLGINIEKPRYDQSTYTGRAKHFFIVTNPLNLLAGNAKLEESKRIVSEYRNGGKLPGITGDQLWRAKQLYDSTYHPDTGGKMFLLGRMSAQVPCNMVITGCMMTFYKTTPAVIFWQWINQSFNALAYGCQPSSNQQMIAAFPIHSVLCKLYKRSGPNPISPATLGWSYCGATTGAITTALFLNKVVAPRFPPLVGRFVPFAAVAAANAINLPMMRSSELTNGIPVLTADGEEVGKSSKAAQSAISQVVVSRIGMAAPGMFIPPIIMAKLEKGPFLTKYPKMNAPCKC
ncbi:SFXN1 [Bugula neritina]|uniref:SFXN1 n=1 Tax=Bugula neritina TaxID=10212 RepID=A0A7J7KSC9_BUGNE|nr:SFXN1 [Bugula neritina]